MIRGRFIEGTIRVGNKPRVEVSEEGRHSYDPPLQVTLMLGNDGECHMTVEQWLGFVSEVGKALQEEGLLNSTREDLTP